MTELAWVSWTPEGMTFGTTDERICVYSDCRTRLSRFNDGAYCGLHERSDRRPW